MVTDPFVLSNSRTLRNALCALVLIGLFSAAPVAATPEWDPAVAIANYTAALNAHDLPAALALFHQYGSATDIRGRHYEGQARLTEFLLSTGFSSPDAHIQTVGVHIVGNRAVWTYMCSCQTDPTEVRMVMNQNKISVFAIMPPPAAPLRKAAASPMAWPVGIALAGIFACVFTVVTGIYLVRRRARPEADPDDTHGQLLSALALARPRTRAR